MPRNATALLKPVQPDEVLGAIVGSQPISRGEITKRVWVYVKSNGLQDGRTINPDAKLAELFGDSSPRDMFAIAKAIAAHVSKVE